MRRIALIALIATAVPLAVAACDRTPPEPSTKAQAEPPLPSAPLGAALAPPVVPSATAAVVATATTKVNTVKPAADDPRAGKWSLDDALAGIKGTGALVASIDTSLGKLSCKLFEDRTPLTVANFVGLATGKRPWKNPNTGTWVTKPAYDGTTFHRIIRGFMIQGGDALGNGSGEPGYVIPDELWAGAKHDRAGLLCMANRGPDTNGAQFFITDAAAKHLDSGYTIFGECAPEKLVHDIASVPVNGERPETKVVIKTVTIAREKPEK